MNLSFERSVPLLFLLVTLAAYGLLLPFTGFYWDDWPFAWMAKFLGPQEFIPAFAGVRPFLGPIFFRDDKLGPARSSVLADLCPPHPLDCRTIRLVCADANLAAPSATDTHYLASFSGLPRLQSALGGIYSHQPGMDSLYFLSAFVWFLRPRPATTLRAGRNEPTGE